MQKKREPHFEPGNEIMSQNPSAHSRNPKLSQLIRQAQEFIASERLPLRVTYNPRQQNTCTDTKQYVFLQLENDHLQSLVLTLTWRDWLTSAEWPPRRRFDDRDLARSVFKPTHSPSALALQLIWAMSEMLNSDIDSGRQKLEDMSPSAALLLEYAENLAYRSFSHETATEDVLSSIFLVYAARMEARRDFELLEKDC